MAVAEYTRRAIDKYNAKFDRVAVNLPKGTKERVKELTGVSCNVFINEILSRELDRLEAERGGVDTSRNNTNNSIIMEVKPEPVAVEDRPAESVADRPAVNPSVESLQALLNKKRAEAEAWQAKNN